MKNNETLYDKLIYRLKNNLFIAILLLFFTIFAGVYSFIQMFGNIFNTFSNNETSKTQILDGTWQSDTYSGKDINERWEYFYTFNFKQFNKNLSGKVIFDKTIYNKTVDHSSKEYGIVEGNISGSIISFHTKYMAYVKANTNNQYDLKEFTDTFMGEIKDDIIMLSEQNSDGTPPFELRIHKISN